MVWLIFIIFWFLLVILELILKSFGIIVKDRISHCSLFDLDRLPLLFRSLSKVDLFDLKLLVKTILHSIVDLFLGLLLWESVVLGTWLIVGLLLLREFGDPRIVVGSLLLWFPLRSIRVAVLPLVNFDRNYLVRVHLPRAFIVVRSINPFLGVVSFVFKDFLLLNRLLLVKINPTCHASWLLSQGLSFSSSSTFWEVLLRAIGTFLVGRVVQELFLLEGLKELLINKLLLLKLSNFVLKVLKWPFQIFDMLKILFV